MKAQITQKKSKGYKQTEIGVIPEDWNVVRLNLLSNDIGDGIHSTPKYVDSSNYFFVNGNNLSDGRILITRDTKCISEDEYESLKKNLDNTTILMSINGTIGNLAFFNNETVVLGKSAAYIKLSQEIDKIFIYYLLQHSSIKKFYDNELTGTTIKNLSLASIRSTPIPIPPTKPEQTAIATALSDTDALIERLGKLIAKKKAIKQGAMQQLLTGKKRLPGFSGEWEVKNVDDIFKFKQGVQCPIEKQKFHDGHKLKRFVRIIDLTQPSELPRYIDDPGLDHHISKDDLFMVRYGNPGLLGYGYEGVIANNLFRLIPKIKISSHFYYYLLSYRNKEILQLSSSTTMAALNFESLKLLKLVYPQELEEQTAIATILSDMDAEIESLKQKRDKYIMLKQGMMQQLLTGRIRIYDNN